MRDVTRYATTRLHGKPARPPPLIGGNTATCNHLVAEGDEGLIIEALRIAAQTLRDTADSLGKLWPTSPMIERLRIAAEQMNALRQQREQQ